MSARLTLKLNNGMVMPMAGIGTFLLSLMRRRHPASALLRAATA